jgi:hypothetical protein
LVCFGEVLEDFDVIINRIVKKVLLDESTLPSTRILEEFEKLDWLLAVERRDEAMLKFFFMHFVMNNELKALRL